MAWIASIDVSINDAEIVTARLWDEGSNGVAEVASDHGVRLIAGFGSETDATQALANLDLIGSIAPVDPSSWEPPPSRSLAVGGHSIVIDAEHSFGHGDHPTTRLCLDLLAGQVHAADNVLDIGTGSGVLAVAASKLGARAATGIDIDSTVITTARANNTRNKTSATFAATPIAEVDGTYSLVVANLLLANLTPIGSQIARVASDRVILSGFLTEQSDRAEAALQSPGRARWREVDRVSCEGWVGLVFAR